MRNLLQLDVKKSLLFNTAKLVDDGDGDYCGNTILGTTALEIKENPIEFYIAFR